MPGGFYYNSIWSITLNVFWKPASPTSAYKRVSTIRCFVRGLAVFDVSHLRVKKVVSSNGFLRLRPSSYFPWWAQTLCRCPGMIATVSRAAGLRGSRWLPWSGRFVRSRSRRRTAARGSPPPARSAQLSGHSARTPRPSLHTRSVKHQARIWRYSWSVFHDDQKHKCKRVSKNVELVKGERIKEYLVLCGLGLSKTRNLYFP